MDPKIKQEEHTYESKKTKQKKCEIMVHCN
jgi:hypothetical protein